MASSLVSPRSRVRTVRAVLPPPALDGTPAPGRPSQWQKQALPATNRANFFKTPRPWSAPLCTTIPQIAYTSPRAQQRPSTPRSSRSIYDPRFKSVLGGLVLAEQPRGSSLEAALARGGVSTASARAPEASAAAVPPPRSSRPASSRAARPLSKPVFMSTGPLAAPAASARGARPHTPRTPRTPRAAGTFDGNAVHAATPAPRGPPPTRPLHSGPGAGAALLVPRSCGSHLTLFVF